MQSQFDYLSASTQLIIQKWTGTFPDKKAFIEEAVFEFDKYLSKGLKPSQINDYDCLVDKVNDRCKRECEKCEKN